MSAQIVAIERAVSPVDSVVVRRDRCGNITIERCGIVQPGSMTIREADVDALCSALRSVITREQPKKGFPVPANYRASAAASAALDEIADILGVERRQR